MSNDALIDKTVEITVARMANTNISPNGEGGRYVAAFMQVIYDKLVELNKNSNS